MRFPGFDVIVPRFDASTVVHSRSSSRRTPDRSWRPFPQRSPPRLLTAAACGGLGSPPDRRSRRAFLHHRHSTVHDNDLLHRHHSPFRTHRIIGDPDRTVYPFGPSGTCRVSAVRSLDEPYGNDGRDEPQGRPPEDRAQVGGARSRTVIRTVISQAESSAASRLRPPWRKGGPLPGRHSPAADAEVPPEM
jgi:hypothetical protein